MNAVVVGGALVVALASCDKRKPVELDRCEKIWNELAQTDPEGAKAADKTSFVEQCRQKQSGKSEIKGETTANPAAEAEQLLRRLGKHARSAFSKSNAFPAATLPLTPSEPCCKGEHGKCAFDKSKWKPFDAVGFDPRGAHFFQYSYESTEPTKYVAKAVGDLDCDGTMITYALEVNAVDGKLHERIVAPANPD